MNIVDDSPFHNQPDHNDPGWPMRSFTEVSAVVHTFSTTDPTLFTPLLTNEARAQALRDHGGQCLNCGRRDHSMKTCRQTFTNSSGILNPALGMLNDNDQAFRRWQTRMRSYRRGDYERNLERNSNNYNNNSRSNHGNNNHRSNQGNNNGRSNHGRSRRHNGRSNNGRYNNNDNYDGNHNNNTNRRRDNSSNNDASRLPLPPWPHPPP